jgi:ABC-type dipeptide/oligopeptide/nickel transport system permease subunit
VWSFPVLLAGVAVGTTLALQHARAASKIVTAVLIGVVSVPYVARPVRAHVIAVRRTRRSGRRSTPGWRRSPRHRIS